MNLQELLISQEGAWTLASLRRRGRIFRWVGFQAAGGYTPLHSMILHYLLVSKDRVFLVFEITQKTNHSKPFSFYLTFIVKLIDWQFFCNFKYRIGIKDFPGFILKFKGSVPHVQKGHSTLVTEKLLIL